jgi:Fe-Mn family superoxide dismutase
MYQRSKFRFEYKTLEPVLNEKTMSIHSEKHHQAYTDNLNTVVEEAAISDMSIEEILRDLETVPEDLRSKVRNNGGGFLNHNLFFSILAPANEGIHEGVKDFESLSIVQEITKTFGSFELFKEKMNTAGLAQFGSGWVFLLRNSNSKALEIKSFPNQDTPIMNGDTPVLGLDVWEHAYYLNYQNKRADYLKEIWKVIDWKMVDEIA